MSRSFHPFGGPRDWKRPVSHRVHWRRWARFYLAYPSRLIRMQWRWPRAHRVLRNRQFRRRCTVDPHALSYDAYVHPLLRECYFGYML